MHRQRAARPPGGRKPSGGMPPCPPAPRATAARAAHGWLARRACVHTRAHWPTRNSTCAQASRAFEAIATANDVGTAVRNNATPPPPKGGWVASWRFAHELTWPSGECTQNLSAACTRTRGRLALQTSFKQVKVSRKSASRSASRLVSLSSRSVGQSVSQQARSATPLSLSLSLSLSRSSLSLSLSLFL